MNLETSSVGLPTSISHCPAAWRKSFAEAISTLEASHGGSDKELKWALAYADRIDPLTSCRKAVDEVKAKHANASGKEGDEEHPNEPARRTGSRTDQRPGRRRPD
jgi:hypothetical protein